MKREVMKPANAEPVRYAIRYSDQPTSWRTRMVGVGGTAGVALVFLLVSVVGWHMVGPATNVPQPLAVVLQPLAAPTELAEEVPEGPKQVEQPEQKQKEQPQPAPPEIRSPLASPIPIVVRPVTEQSVPTEAVPRTTAPKAIPAPPANRISSDSEATWEARLLAHLEKYRRYPAAARGRGEQGVAHVAFRMSRLGRVLSVRIARSSGSKTLDRAALETVRRAQPLPEPPSDKPDEIELSVAVEFFVTR